MPTTRNIHLFIKKNVTFCRVFWGLMYTTFFILACRLFHSTQIYTDNVTVRRTIYFALVFIICPLVVLPIVYIAHQAVKDRVNTAIVVFGARTVNAVRKFLTTVTFPLVSVYLGKRLDDVATMWMCIALAGSVFSLLICYANPDDYGSSDAFLAIWFAVLVNVEHILAKCMVAKFILASELEEAILRL